jgi:ABC-type antimicrobial peptide transport system permease subunit
MKWGRTDSENPWLDIIGVVQDVREGSLSNNLVAACYVPFARDPQEAMDLAIRTAGDPYDMVEALRETVWSLDPDLPLHGIQGAEEVMWKANWRPVISAWLFTAFSVIALLMAAVGIYGVIAFAIVQRTRELGIRITLGARTKDVVSLVLRQTALLAGVGLLLGLAIAMAGMRVMSSLLYEISPTDSPTYAVALLAMATVVTIAAVAPLRRALRLDPMEIIRQG